MSVKAFLLISITTAVSAILPVLPLRIATAGSWPSPLPGGRFFGDVRAVLAVASSDISPVASVTAQVRMSASVAMPMCCDALVHVFTAFL
jgi:hypothetical protein